MIHVRQSRPGWINLIDSETLEGHTIPVEAGSRHTMSYDCTCGPTLGITQTPEGRVTDAYAHKKTS